MKKFLAFTLALVLCVGMLCISVSADYSYVAVTGTMNGWDTSSEYGRMTDNGDGTYTVTFEDMAAGEHKFKFTANGNWNDLNLGGSYMGSGVEADLYWSGADIVINVAEVCDVTIVLDLTNFDGTNGAKFTVNIGNQVDEAPEAMVLHVSVPESWGAAYVYVWGPEHLGSWPGTLAENGTLEVTASFAGMVINNGNGTQGWDITDIDLTKGEVWITVNEDGSYTLSYEAPAGEEPAAPTLEDGKYVIAWGDLTFAALAEDKPYGYAPAGDVNALAETDYITITNVDGGFTMQDCYGRYIYMKGTYNSFNVATEATESYLWTLEETEGGYYIKNVGMEKYIAYSEQYSTWGCYASVSDTSVVTITAVVEEEPAPEVNTIKINVIAEHWTNIYAYTFNSELNGSWPGTLVENGSFEVLASFEGLVLNNGEGQQTADIKDIDLTQAEVWITVNADNTYTLSYEAPVVEPIIPGTGDNFVACVLVMMFSAACLLGLSKKKEF